MYGISDKLIQEIVDIKNKYNIELIIFGSRAKGFYKETSDIDLAVLTNVNEEAKYKIMDEFEQLNTAYKIDLVFMQNITNEKFSNEIKKEGKSL